MSTLPSGCEANSSPTRPKAVGASCQVGGKPRRAMPARCPGGEAPRQGACEFGQRHPAGVTFTPRLRPVDDPFPAQLTAFSTSASLILDWSAVLPVIHSRPRFNRPGRLSPSCRSQSFSCSREVPLAVHPDDWQPEHERQAAGGAGRPVWPPASCERRWIGTARTVSLTGGSPIGLAANPERPGCGTLPCVRSRPVPVP
jgi:hypothetical protein